MSDIVSRWRELTPLFLMDAAPEFVLSNMRHGSFASLLLWLFELGRDLDTRFTVPGSRRIVLAASPQTAAQRLASGALIGIFCATMPCTPILTFVVAGDGTLRLVLEIENSWTPIMLESFLQFVSECLWIAPEAVLEISPEAPQIICSELIQAWQEYQYVPAT